MVLKKTSSGSLPAPIKTSKRLVLNVYYGLIICFGVDTILISNDFTLTVVLIWLIRVMPLLPFSVGLHQNHPRTYTWLSFVVLLYFINGVLVSFDPERQIMGIVYAVLSVTLFSFLILFVRLYREHYQVNL